MDVIKVGITLKTKFTTGICFGKCRADLLCMTNQNIANKRFKILRNHPLEKMVTTLCRWIMLFQLISDQGTKKHSVCDEVKLALSGREDEPLLDVAAGTGIVGKHVSSSSSSFSSYFLLG